MNTELNILIADDEPPARERLKRMIGKIDGVALTGEAANGTEALALTENLQPDVLILDINMPDIDGMRVLEAMDDPPAVIFSTAYEQYAVKAFEKEAVDYLLKPYSQARLEKALIRARQWLGLQFAESQDSAASSAPPRIKADNGLATELVPANETILLRIEEGVVFLYRSDGDKLTCAQSLQELEEELPSSRFFRSNRQSILNLDHVNSYQPAGDGSLSVVLSGGIEECISRRRARHFRGLLK